MVAICKGLKCTPYLGVRGQRGAQSLLDHEKVVDFRGFQTTTDSEPLWKEKKLSPPPLGKILKYTPFTVFVEGRFEKTVVV